MVKQILARLIPQLSGLFIVRRKVMLRLLMCLFGLHGATEIDYTIDDEEIKVCRDCLKEVK